MTAQEFKETVSLEEKKKLVKIHESLYMDAIYYREIKSDYDRHKNMKHWRFDTHGYWTTTNRWDADTCSTTMEMIVSLQTYFSKN